MFDIIVNGQVVAVVVEDIVRVVMNALIGALPLQVSIESRPHIEPQPEINVEPEVETK